MSIVKEYESNALYIYILDDIAYHASEDRLTIDQLHFIEFELMPDSEDFPNGLGDIFNFIQGCKNISVYHL